MKLAVSCQGTSFDKVQPMIVAPPHNPKNWQDVLAAFRDYNEKQISLPILYFEFIVECGEAITFQRMEY